jgi:hypothetical protein
MAFIGDTERQKLLINLCFLKDLYNYFAGHFYLCQLLVNLWYFITAMNPLWIKQLSDTHMEESYSSEYDW